MTTDTGLTRTSGKGMRKVLRIFLRCAAGLAAMLIVFVITMFIMYPAEYMARYLLWRTSDIRDYEKFPFHEVHNESPPYLFAVNLKEDEIRSLFNQIDYTWRGTRNKIGDLDAFLSDTGTTALLVIQDDALLYEKYFNGYQRDSINTSFSMAKSFTSALIGAAIEDGAIGGVNDPLIQYIPELRGKGLDNVTLRNLLMMTSGLQYRDTKLPGDIDFPWGSDPLTYYFPDLRKTALSVVPEEAPGLHFHYNNYHPLLLGMVLERTTKKSVAAYLEEKIWTQLGMEFPGSWSIDSEESGFEKMESGINARSIDFAKFGRLFLNRGNWNGRQILPEEWVAESTTPPAAQPADYYARYADSVGAGPFFSHGDGYYKYMWWGYSNSGGEYDFFADGHLGQFIYVCPQKNLIIVRNGKTTGKVDFWPDILHAAAHMIQPNMGGLPLES